LVGANFISSGGSRGCDSFDWLHDHSISEFRDIPSVAVEAHVRCPC
jgi:hypothetical protein